MHQRPITHFHQWPDSVPERIRLLAAAGCGVELQAQALDLRPVDVVRHLEAQGLTPGAGCTLFVDDQVRCLHSAGLSQSQIAEVVGYFDAKSVSIAYKRLGLVKNGWNARARKLRAKQARKQVMSTVGRKTRDGTRSGKTGLIELVRHHWRVVASKHGWGHLLDRTLPHIKPPMVAMLDVLADSDKPLSRAEIVERCGYAAGSAGTFRARYLDPLVKAGFVAAAWHYPHGRRIGALLLYRLADGIDRHGRTDRPDGIDLRTGFHRATFTPRFSKRAPAI